MLSVFHQIQQTVYHVQEDSICLEASVQHARVIAMNVTQEAYAQNARAELVKKEKVEVHARYVQTIAKLALNQLQTVKLAVITLISSAPHVFQLKPFLFHSKST